MDVNAPVHNAKTRKLSEEWNMDMRRNRIGNLPDVILEHILSFLSMKSAARTSLLSKRWQYLWMSIPDLDFNSWKPEKRKVFMNLVERILLLRDSNIRKFSLSCDVQNDASRVNAWVFAVVRHKVEELVLNLYGFQKPFVLPSCLFNCDSLTKLKLRMGLACKPNFYDLKLPSYICFSNLKILDLRHVVFPDDNSTQQLFSGCPVLEELSLIYCSWANITVVSISAPMLRKLSIVDRKLPEDDDAEDQISSNGCQVVIFGTNLKSFLYNGELRNDYCLYNLSSLVDAHIEVRDISREVAYRTIKLLRGLCNVKSLTLSFVTLEVLSEAEELLAHLPAFNNLTSLKLDIDLSFSYYHGALLDILQNTPCLNSLKFTQGLFSFTHCKKDDWIIDPVPPCFLTHLKTIRISEFIGSEDELQNLTILLKNGMVLEKIVIYFNPCFSDYTDLTQEEIQEQVFLLPKESMGCKIVFS